jgi:serine/threonine protein kinase
MLTGEVGEQFEVISPIGSGTFGLVCKCRSRSTGGIVAVKRIRTIRCSNGLPESIRREIDSLTALSGRSPHICQLIGNFISDDNRSVFLVFDYCEYDLHGLMSTQLFSEAQVKSYLFQLLTAVKAVHEAGLLHRDIKPANVLLQTNNFIKLADFGVSTEINSPDSRPKSSRTGTLCYVAPEILLADPRYGPSVDVWSIGCVFYELMTGNILFQGRTESDQFHAIVHVKGPPPNGIFDELPNFSLLRSIRSNEGSFGAFLDQTKVSNFPGAKSLLMRLLDWDPKHRIDCSTALADEFFLGTPPPQELPVFCLPELHHGGLRRSAKKNMMFVKKGIKIDVLKSIPALIDA